VAAATVRSSPAAATGGSEGLLAGRVGAPALAGLRDWLGGEHPDVELEIEEGSRPHYALLLSAE
jgi:hypothetical protein